MNNMISMNVSVEVGQCGAACSKKPRFVMVAKIIQQRQVTRRTEIRNKWLDVIKAGKLQAEYDITLKVQAASRNHSNNVNQRSRVFNLAPASDGQFIKKGHTFCSGDQDVFIKMPNNSIELTALAVLLCNVLMSIEITHLDKVVVVTLILVAISRHQSMKGTNHSGDSLQITPNTIRLLLVPMIGVMGISGARAEDLNDGFCLIDSANAVAVGNVLEEGDNFKVAAIILAVMVVGGAVLMWMSKRRSKFDTKGGLRRTPVIRKSTPGFEIYPKLDERSF